MAEGRRQKAEGLPEGWETVQIQDKAKVVVGFVGNVNDHYTDPSGIPFYRTQNVRAGKFTHENIEYVTQEFHAKNKKSLIKNGDILIARVGANLGMVAKVEGLKGEANSANVIIVRPDTSLDSSFCAYFLNSTIGQMQIFGGAAGGAQGVFNTKLAQKIFIPLPPLPEQQKIAAILSTWDDSIATLSHLLTAKRQQKRGLAEALLTGKKRLPGFEGEWEEARLGRHIFEVSQRNKNSTVERVLSVTNHSGFVLPEEQFSKRVASENISNYKIVKQGQFAYNPSRLNVGSLARLDSFSEGIVSPLYVVFDVMNSLDRNYLLYWLESPLAESKIKASVQGSVRDSVSFDALSSFAIALPPLPEQKAIASILSALDGEIASLEALKAKVQEQKRGLMDELLTGRVRVKVEG